MYSIVESRYKLVYYRSTSLLCLVSIQSLDYHSKVIYFFFASARTHIHISFFLSKINGKLSINSTSSIYHHTEVMSQNTSKLLIDIRKKYKLSKKFLRIIIFTRNGFIEVRCPCTWLHQLLFPRNYAVFHRASTHNV